MDSREVSGSVAPPLKGFTLPIADRDAFRLPLRLDGFRQGDSEHAVAERGADLVLLNVLHRDAALEVTVMALGEKSILIFRLGLLLAFDNQHSIRQLEFDVLFV